MVVQVYDADLLQIQLSRGLEGVEGSRASVEEPGVIDDGKVTTKLLFSLNRRLIYPNQGSLVHRTRLRENGTYCLWYRNL